MRQTFVRSGRLAPGTMLPPSRSLATDLGLARNTVAEAYAELVAEGWLASKQGAGTWVVNTGGDIRQQLGAQGKCDLLKQSFAPPPAQTHHEPRG